MTSPAVRPWLLHELLFDSLQFLETDDLELIRLVCKTWNQFILIEIECLPRKFIKKCLAIEETSPRMIFLDQTQILEDGRLITNESLKNCVFSSVKIEKATRESCESLSLLVEKFGPVIAKSTTITFLGIGIHDTVEDADSIYFNWFSTEKRLLSDLIISQEAKIEDLDIMTLELLTKNPTCLQVNHLLKRPKLTINLECFTMDLETLDVNKFMEFLCSRNKIFPGIAPKEGELSISGIMPVGEIRVRHVCEMFKNMEDPGKLFDYIGFEYEGQNWRTEVANFEENGFNVVNEGELQEVFNYCDECFEDLEKAYSITRKDDWKLYILAWINEKNNDEAVESYLIELLTV